MKKGKNKKGEAKEDGSNISKENKKKDKYKNSTYFNCNEKGHLARDCPANHDEEDEDTSIAGMTCVGCEECHGGCCAMGSQKKKLHKDYEV
jgi:hypothetical protein